MLKIAILTDSNSGITREEADNLNIYVLPMPFYIDDEVFFEDIDLTQEEFYKRLEDNCKITTSMPVVGDLLDKWDKLLEDYDQIVYIPMSSSLSSSCQTAHMLSLDDEYEDKVFVVDNQRISVTMRESVLDAKYLAEKGYNGEDIKNILEDHKRDSSIYISLVTLEYLSRGGRLTKGVAALGNILRIKPVLQIQGGKLDTFARGRTLEQCKQTMISAIKEDIKNRFDDDPSIVEIAIAHTDNEEEAIKFREEVLEIWPDREIVINPLSLSVACHIGPGSLAITVGRRIGSFKQYK
ncbi:MAG TPA: DegV family protein [Lachnospiraceae bacterium]|nr:DegV family protein [Lachnospiraceae bacterium]